MIYKSQYNALLAEPEVEMPKIKFYQIRTPKGDESFCDENEYKAHDKAYNNWLSSQIPVVGKHSWKDGQIVKEGVDYILMDTNKWYYAKCGKCGYETSSENFGTINYGDDADVVCPKCYSTEVDEYGDYPSYEGTVAIPIKEGEDYEPSQTTSSEPVASHSCTFGNSIEQ